MSERQIHVNKQNPTVGQEPTATGSGLGVSPGHMANTYRELARRIYGRMEESHKTYCDFRCFTIGDVEEMLLAYESRDAERIEKLKEKFGSLAWQHFYSEFIHFYHEEVGEE